MWTDENQKEGPKENGLPSLYKEFAYFTHSLTHLLTYLLTYCHCHCHHELYEDSVWPM